MTTLFVSSVTERGWQMMRLTRAAQNKARNSLGDKLTLNGVNEFHFFAGKWSMSCSDIDCWGCRCHARFLATNSTKFIWLQFVSFPFWREMRAHTEKEAAPWQRRLVIWSRWGESGVRSSATSEVLRAMNQTELTIEPAFIAHIHFNPSRGGAANLHTKLFHVFHPRKMIFRSHLNANRGERKEKVEVAQLFVIYRTRVIKASFHHEFRVGEAEFSIFGRVGV